MNAIELLLVEDDPVDAEMFRRAAKKQGLDYPVRHAADGSIGLSMLRGMRDCWPLAFVDVNMPGINGHDFLEAVREDESIQGTVVFMLTTSAHERDIRQAYDRQAAGYFRKDEIGTLMRSLEHYASCVQRPGGPEACGLG